MSAEENMVILSKLKAETCEGVIFRKWEGSEKGEEKRKQRVGVSG